MINFNEKQVQDRIEKRIAKAQYLLDQQVIKDSNYYVPVDQHGLEDSALLNNTLGEVKWAVEYAKTQYYEYENKSKDKNPNASMKWFEVAKANRLKEWEKLANAEYNS